MQRDSRRRARCRSTSIRRSSRDDDPASGFAISVGAAALLDRATGPARNRLGDAGRNAFVEGLSDARAHHAQRDRRDAGAWPRATAREWLEAAADADERAAALGGTTVRADYENAPTRAHRSSSAATSTRAAFGRLRRADDALRRDEAADLAHAAARRSAPDGDRRRAARRLHRPGGVCGSWSARSWRCTASRSARSPARAQAIDAEVFRATKVTLGAGIVRRPPAARARRRVDPRARATSARARCSCRSRRRRRALAMTLLEPQATGLAGQLGLLQHRVRAQGIHGGVRRRGRGARRC